MAELFSEFEIRVVGSLIEKQLTTPEYYPLTMNGLVAACNQKSNRDPVMNLDETTILAAVESLRERNLVYLYYGSTSRAVKYKHMLPSVYELSPAEVAVMAVLFLRGAQTVGELRERTSRMHTFSGLGEVQETLDSLTRRDEPLVAKIERQAGQKEARFAHLLAGPVRAETVAADVRSAQVAVSQPLTSDRIAQLEQNVDRLQTELNSFRETFDEFRKQFD
ncbi:MAG: YceH family protein [Pyrinomonadaceae bacterium]